MEDPATLAVLLADAALDAWNDVADAPDRNRVVRTGADGTPTTRADAALDEAILEAAAALGLTVLSEESGLVDHGSSLWAVVDPLDGSRNAGRGIPFHCTSVAVGRDDVTGVEAAAVVNLATGDRYTAVRGQGTRVNGAPPLPQPYDPDEIMVAVIVDYSEGEVEDQRRHAGHHIRDLGSSALELCLVGTGALDGFLVRQPWLRVIDIAAGVLFVEESGGVVLDPADGRRLATPFDLAARTGVIAARSPEALEAVR